jgi:hypothetical protein
MVADILRRVFAAAAMVKDLGWAAADAEFRKGGVDWSREMCPCMKAFRGVGKGTVN